jgi:hypothetical protein
MVDITWPTNRAICVADCKLELSGVDLTSKRMCRCAFDCDLIGKLEYFCFYLGGHFSVPLSSRQLSYIKHPKIKFYIIENVLVVLLQ